MKLHKVKTVVKYAAASYSNSRMVKRMMSDTDKKSRLRLYFSLIYWYCRYGFDFNDYVTFRFWEKSHDQRKAYISFRRNDVLRFRLSTPEAYRIFLDKGTFNRKFNRFINRGWIVSNNVPKGEIEDFIRQYETIIAKPLDNYGGKGVIKLSPDTLTPEISEQLAKGNYILEQRIINSDSIRTLAPGSLNTIRIVTLIDKNGRLQILAALLRMGNGTALTDNYHDGGMACPIDIKTGQLTKTAYAMGGTQYTAHPYSKIPFEGYPVEGFLQCLGLLPSITETVKEARYVGWDFAVTPKGIELLEGNIPPGEDITQLATGHGIWHEINSLI